MLTVARTIGLDLEAARTHEEVHQERARRIAFYEAYLSIQQHPELEDALREVTEAFVRMGWRAARCWAFDKSGGVLAQGESDPSPRFPSLKLELWLRGDPHLERRRQGDWLYLIPAEEELAARRAVLPPRDASGLLMALVELEAPTGAQDQGEALRRPTERLATLLRIAFDRGRPLRRYARNLREQTTLYRALSALLRPEEPGPILTEIAAALCEAPEGTSACFLTVTVDPEQGTTGDAGPLAQGSASSPRPLPHARPWRCSALSCAPDSSRRTVAWRPSLPRWRTLCSSWIPRGGSSSGTWQRSVCSQRRWALCSIWGSWPGGPWRNGARPSGADSSRWPRSSFRSGPRCGRTGS
jgi:hypothetical protein